MKATKKLIGAAVALVAAASLTVGSTFAWFSARDNATIDAAKFTVDSQANALQIAIQAASATVDPAESAYKYTISSTDIQTAVNNGAPDPVKYSALTSDDDGITLTKKGSATNVTEGYATFKLYMRTNIEDAYLVLDNTSEIAAVDPKPAAVPVIKSPIAIAQNAYGLHNAIAVDGEIKDVRAANAARIAFINGGDSVVWAPHETLDNTISNIGDKTNDAPAGYYENNLAYDYNKAMDSTTDPVTVATYTHRVYAAKDPANASDPVKYYAENKIAQFGNTKAGDGYYHLTLTVKIWLEGTDGDCFDAILNDEFLYNLSFKAIKNYTTSS